jgi:repressor LexA
MKPLTDRQQRILGFLEEHSHRNGYPPTLREVAAHFGLSGPRGAQKHLEALQKKGYLERFPRRSRAIFLSQPKPDAGSLLLPVLGRVRAGAPLLAREEVEDHLSIAQTLVPSPAEGMFVLRIKGDSMIRAGLLEGDYAVVRPQADARNGEIVVALIEDEATVKRFFRDRNGLRLEPANPEYRPIPITPATKGFRLIGKVVTVIRRLP